MKGLGKTYYQHIASIDILSETKNATDASRLVLSYMTSSILLGRGKYLDGVVPISIDEHHETEWYKGYKELSDLRLIIRVKPGHYLLNPEMLVPTNYKEAITIWNKHVIVPHELVHITVNK